jgi:microcompartment protein CcmL/EutN
MTKDSEVRLISRKFVGGSNVTVLVRGETSAVNAAVRAGADACERVGDGLAAAHIIARPHQEVEQILPRYPDGRYPDWRYPDFRRTTTLRKVMTAQRVEQHHVEKNTS